MFLPINEIYYPQGRNGTLYRVEISVEETSDLEKYPEKVKANFRMLKFTEEGKEELVALIDNHKPFGFHYHDKLPDEHSSRIQVYTDSWQTAWTKFQEICKEILNEL